MRKIISALVLAIILASSAAFAEIPTPVSSTNLSGSIAVTNTFQVIQNSNGGRQGCAIQNQTTNSNNQWVFFGPVASATKAKSVVLIPGQSVNCQFSGIVLLDQISITGTGADTFLANFQ